MSEAAWHTVDECIGLGIVDEAIDGTPADVTTGTVNFIKYNNMPALPDIVNTWKPEKKRGFFGKVMDRINQSKVISMIKNWTNINSLLSVEGFESDDSRNCTVSEEQMQKIEDRIAGDAARIADVNEKLKTVTDERDSFKAKIDNLEKENKDLKDKVKTLEDEPGGETHNVEDTQPVEIDNSKIFNALNQFV